MAQATRDSIRTRKSRHPTPPSAATPIASGDVARVLAAASVSLVASAADEFGGSAMADRTALEIELHRTLAAKHAEMARLVQEAWAAYEAERERDNGNLLA